MKTKKRVKREADDDVMELKEKRGKQKKICTPMEGLPEFKAHEFNSHFPDVLESLLVLAVELKGIQQELT